MAGQSLQGISCDRLYDIALLERGVEGFGSSSSREAARAVPVALHRVRL